MNEYSLEQAMKAQAALRDAAGAGEERFDSRQLIGMLSDEIRVLRDSGLSDQEIATLLETKADLAIDADTIGKFYVDTSEYQTRE